MSSSTTSRQAMSVVLIDPPRSPGTRRARAAPWRARGATAPADWSRVRSSALRTSSDVQPEHVAQPDHLGLHRRQRLDRSPRHLEGLGRQQPVLGDRRANRSGSSTSDRARPGRPNPGTSRGRTRERRGRRPPASRTGTLRPSRCPRVFAMFVRIRKIHVRNDDRPSNRSIPFSTPSQASCTTSSATACDDTYMRATRSIEGCRASTSSMNASSSPARRR